MDPVSVFNALYDTKCIKFGRYHLRSGLVAPYYINLRRLPLYPELMEAVVTQVAEKFLSSQALICTMSQLRQKQRRSSSSASRIIRSSVVSTISKELDMIQIRSKEQQMVAADVSNDSDSQLGEEEIETCSDDCDWDSGASYTMDPIISGVPYGAIPIAVAAAFMAKLPYLFERKETKLHGDHQPLMEDFNEETRSVYPVDSSYLLNRGADEEAQKIKQLQQQQQQQVIIIEDVICSGESILESVRQLERQNLKVEFVICIIDREENGVNLLLQEAGVHVLCLYKISAILRVLEATGRITSKQFISTRQWIDQNQFQAIGRDPSQENQTTTAASRTQAAAAKGETINSNPGTEAHRICTPIA